MCKEYSAAVENLATLAIDSLSPEALGSCDPVCGMSLVELRDFWWAYCYDLIGRLPATTQTHLHLSLRILKTNADMLLVANNATSEDFFRRRVEPRLGQLHVVRFGFLHLLPTLAEKIDPGLKTEVEALINERYGSSNS